MPPKARKVKSPRKGNTGRSRRSGRSAFNNKDEADYKMQHFGGGISGGVTSIWTKAVAQPDVMVVKMRYETTSAFTSTAGAASYVQVKGNSIYRPYVGNTDSVGGYARMFADYEFAGVLKSEITVRLWGGVAGQDEPFRVIVIPVSPTQYTTYSGFSNIGQLYDVPHAVQGVFSPGGKLPVIRARGSNATVNLGQSGETGIELTSGSMTQYCFGTALDPSSLWYYLIGYQNFAGTTTTNQQAQVSMEYTVKWMRPIATPVQFAVNKFGNCISTERKTAVMPTETKGTVLAEFKKQPAAPTDENKRATEADAPFPLRWRDDYKALLAGLEAAGEDVTDEDLLESAREFLVWKREQTRSTTTVAKQAVKAGGSAHLGLSARSGKIEVDPG